MIREPFEPPSVRDWALIIHADSAGERVDVYWVDINAGREGLRLASEVKAWRRRDDLLTLAHRLRIVIPDDEPVTPNQIGYPGQSSPEAIDIENPPSIASATKELETLDGSGKPARSPEPSSETVAPSPVEGPSEPVERRTGPERIESRREYLAGRVRAILAHSETASKALARAWPEGVPGLKHSGQSMDDLDRILDAVQFIEKNHSIPFYPEWDDPELEASKLAHPSNVWARPKETKSTPEDKENIQGAIMAHERSALIREWIGYAISGGIDHNIDTTALAHALFEFGKLPEAEWPDEDLTVMLDGSLRALGYANGCLDLGRFNPEHAPFLMSAAFAITAGNAYLLFDAETGKPIVRTNVRKGK